MLEEIQNNRYRLQPAFIQDVIHTSDYSQPIKGKSHDGLPVEVLSGWLYINYSKSSSLIMNFFKHNGSLFSFTQQDFSLES